MKKSRKRQITRLRNNRRTLAVRAKSKLIAAATKLGVDRWPCVCRTVRAIGNARRAHEVRSAVARLVNALQKDARDAAEHIRDVFACGSNPASFEHFKYRNVLMRWDLQLKEDATSKALLSRVLDEDTVLNEWGPFAIVIGRRTASLMFFRYIDDWRQCVVEVALEAAASGVSRHGGKETVRLLGRLWRQKMRDYGFSPRYDIEGETIGGWHAPEVALTVERSAVAIAGLERKERHKCGVPLCGKSAIYTDRRYHWLCRRHYQLVYKRRAVLGWRNPYENIETAGREVSETYMPAQSKNKKLWAHVRLGMSGKEWVQMWEWAKGYRKHIDKTVLEKAMRTIMSQ